MKNLRRQKIIRGTFQSKLLFLIFASAVIPAAVVGFCLYYVIFNLLAKEIGMPETIFYYLIPVLEEVNGIILISLPPVFLIIWFIALDISHRIAGPIYRLEKDLDDRISGKNKSPIKVREKDELQSLVEKINRLIEKVK